MIQAFLGRLFDRTLNEREHRIAIDQLQEALPCKLFLVGPIPPRREINVDGSVKDDGTRVPYDVFVYVDEGRFEALPTRLRAEAAYIEEVRRDGGGIIYKSRSGKTGLLAKTTMPGYKHGRRTAWDRVLEDDD